MIESVPFLAPTSPPETGASMLDDATLCGGVGDFDGERRPAGRHVDEHTALLRSRQARRFHPANTSRTSSG